MKHMNSKARSASLNMYILVLIIVAVTASLITAMVLTKGSFFGKKTTMNKEQQENLSELSSKIEAFYTNKYQ